MGGGKRLSLPKLMKFVPEHIDTYVEPFVGGGAMLFAIKFKRAIINDSNEELINAYRTIRDDVDALIEILKDMPYELEFLRKCVPGTEIKRHFTSVQILNVPHALSIF